MWSYKEGLVIGAGLLVIGILLQMAVGAINWGLVWGKTNTIWPWGSTAGTPEPEAWFHDILYPDGTPRYPEEVEFLHKIIGVDDNGE